MKQFFLYLMLCGFSFVHAQVLDINTSGWRLLGAKETMTHSTFGLNCVQSVWSYNNGAWKAYSPNQTIADAMDTIHILDTNFTLDAGKGFWINTSSACTSNESNTFTQNMLLNQTFYIVQIYPSTNEVWLNSLEDINSSHLTWTEYNTNDFSKSQSYSSIYSYNVQNGQIQFENFLLTLVASVGDYYEVNATFTGEASLMRFYTDPTKALQYYESVNMPSSSDTTTIGNLMWQDNNETSTVTKAWIEFNKYYYNSEYYDTTGDTATTYCDNLNLGGYDDWRLPTRAELTSTQGTTFANIATITPTNTPRYWTSEYAVNTPANAYAMRLTSNSTALVEVSAQKGSSFNVRCVRNLSK